MTVAEPKRPARRTNRGVQKRVVVPTRLDMLMTGELKIEDLDDEEIRRQQLRNKDGDFRGRPPMWIPREMALAFQQEYFKRFQDQMREIVPDAVKSVHEMVKSRHLMPGDATRLRAAEFVVERVFGKVTQNVDQHIVLDKGKTFENYVEEALVDADVIDELDAIEE